FHVNNILSSAIAEGDIVTFDLERGLKGMNAINIRLENELPPVEDIPEE
ncbi:MAG: cold-shock protein, partial [Parabacteroides gordonii]